MPADADLLCEFYLSSQLSSNKSAASLQHTTNPSSRGLNQSSTAASSNFTADTIDFVRYTKNPMSDGLKRKYELLASHNHHHHQQNGATTNTITNSNIAQQSSSPQQQQLSSSLASTISAASNGIKSNLVSSSSAPTTPVNGSHLNGHKVI